MGDGGWFLLPGQAKHPAFIKRDDDSALAVEGQAVAGGSAGQLV